MIQIYTDGAYSSKRNQGGWAFIVISDGKIIHKDFDGLMNTTNNRMEIISVMKAFEWIKDNPGEYEIFSDSMYVIGTLTLNWKRNKNLDLWYKMDEFNQNIVKLTHVKGHSDNNWNNKCDEYAVFASSLINCKNDLCLIS